MKQAPEPSRRPLTTEYITSKLWVCPYFQAVFPGSAIYVAELPSEMGWFPSEMGSFQWTFVEYKEQNGFVSQFFLLAGTGGQAG